MSAWPPRNLDYLQRKDARLYEAVSDLVSGVSTIAQQGNLNPNGNPVAPNAPESIKVKAQNGHFSVSIQDGSQMYRGIQYQVEHADNPHFTNPQRVTIGPSRNAVLNLGNVTRYFRVASFYDSSKPSPYVYHGNAAAPQAINGGGSNGGPAFLDDEGSGTGLAGQPGGSGPVPFRSSTGAPPVRGESQAGGGSGGNPQVNPSAVGIVAQVPTPPSPGSAQITVPASAYLLGSTSGRQLTPAALASGDIIVGNGSGKPAAVAMSGDAAISNTGAVTLATVNPDTGTFGDATHVAQVTLDAKGLATAASSVAITVPGTTGYTGSVALAKLTPVSGTNGSLTVVNGLITAYTAPT